MTPGWTFWIDRGGTFTDVAKETFPHVAWFAMGSDVADLDGNGLEDLFTLDMSGTDHFRQKTSLLHLDFSKHPGSNHCCIYLYRYFLFLLIATSNRS